MPLESIKTPFDLEVFIREIVDKNRSMINAKHMDTYWTNVGPYLDKTQEWMEQNLPDGCYNLGYYLTGKGGFIRAVLLAQDINKKLMSK